ACSLPRRPQTSVARALERRCTPDRRTWHVPCEGAPVAASARGLLQEVFMSHRTILSGLSIALPALLAACGGGGGGGGGSSPSSAPASVVVVPTGRSVHVSWDAAPGA